MLNLFIALLQQVSVFTVLAYLFSKYSRGQLFVLADGSRRRSRAFVGSYLFFSAAAILGTYLGVHVQDALLNTRAIGAVLAGLLGGPTLGLAVGATAGLHRYSLGGFTDLACALSTTTEGLIGGFAYLWLRRQSGARPALGVLTALSVTALAECCQMLIILAVARPFGDALALVRVIGAPMILMNSIGAALFASVLVDQLQIREHAGARFVAIALDVAKDTIELLDDGLTQEGATALAKEFQRRLPVGAVAVTDRRRILAFEGLGADHHVPGHPIGSEVTYRALKDGQVRFLNGHDQRYDCPYDESCPLNSALVVPLKMGHEIVGTIKLYEPREKPFREVYRSFGEGMARLLGAQLSAAKLSEQSKLLMASELKLAQAQVNPHFLFNALNTIRAVIRMDPERGRALVGHLSDFLRSNLKRGVREVGLDEELEHVGAYLKIEEARFGPRLSVRISVPEALLSARVPSFILQPLVENAIKHGIRDLLDGGLVQISAETDADALFIRVEDNGGSYHPPADGEGLGMSLVERRIKSRYGASFGLSVQSEVESFTRVELKLPLKLPEQEDAA